MRMYVRTYVPHSYMRLSTAIGQLRQCKELNYIPSVFCVSNWIKWCNDLMGEDFGWYTVQETLCEMIFCVLCLPCRPGPCACTWWGWVIPNTVSSTSGTLLWYSAAHLFSLYCALDKPGVASTALHCHYWYCLVNIAQYCVVDIVTGMIGETTLWSFQYARP